MTERNYQDMVGEILYSEEMKYLHCIVSPMRGYIDAGSAARDVSRSAVYTAVMNRLDSDYCELLALLLFFKPETFADLIREPRIRKDMADLRGGKLEGISEEARCVALVLETVRQVRSMSREALEAQGGIAIVQCAALDRIQRDENGMLCRHPADRKGA